MGVLEGLLFVTGEDGLSIDDIEKILDLDEKGAKSLLEKYEATLKNEDRGLKLVYLGNKYKLATKEEHQKYYEKLVASISSQNLSQQALETLAIIAYNEPVTVGMIDEVRGVSSRDMVRRLLYRGFVEMNGRSELPGKPMLYKTTDKFLDYFNLSSIDELPKIEDITIDAKEEDLFDSRYKENE